MLARNVFAQTLRQHVCPRTSTIPLAATRALHSTSRVSDATQAHPFSFLPANSLEPKATRNKGSTEIRGPYYAPVTKSKKNSTICSRTGASTSMAPSSQAARSRPCQRTGCARSLKLPHKHG
ncbi:hypothetical protein C8Q74DRAFT_746054 [Fomes fomentarius]|nr:hypothetical protein C8Q74DRAFT_746054 [Fomes fomentarius]